MLNALPPSLLWTPRVALVIGALASVVMLAGCGSTPAPISTGGSGPGGGSGTGGQGTGGQGTGGQGTGGQPSDALDAYVDVPAAGPYGARSMRVHAATNWLNTGLYLRAGQTATLSASGSWAMDGKKFVGPEGLPGVIERGCPRNGLVARLGLLYDDAELYCIGPGADMTATRDGIVYLAANFDTDLGETYGTRLPAEGWVDVEVTSTGDTVPTVQRDEIPTYDFSAVASGWVEVRGTRAIVTIPADDVIKDLSTAPASLDTLDAIYDIEAALRSDVPYRGQRVRFFPDPNIESFAYMLAGNPIRAVPEIMSGSPDQRILRASEAPTDVWGFAHEFGHTFTLSNGTWTYMIVNIESWPNVFTLRALSELNRTHPNKDTYCDKKAAYLAGGTYDEVRGDPFLQLCFLMELQVAYGWDFWSKFFLGISATKNEDIPYSDKDDAPTWGFVRDRFNEAAGTDTTSLFQTWRIPLPPASAAGPKPAGTSNVKRPLPLSRPPGAARHARPAP